MAKFDPFLSLDCARVEGVGAQSKERQGSNFAAQRSGAIVQKPKGQKNIRSNNLAIAIWQPCLGISVRPLLQPIIGGAPFFQTNPAPRLFSGKLSPIPLLLCSAEVGEPWHETEYVC